MTRLDKLGRRIPDFDRSKANKKGAQTKLQKDPDIFSKMGSITRKNPGRGHFGKLKAEDPAKLKEISTEAQKKRAGKMEDEVRGTAE